MVAGEIEIDGKAGGDTMNCTDAECELRVAVSVTVVGAGTWPVCIWNCIHAVLPGMLIVAGTMAAGSELEREIVAPPEGTAPLSCNITNVQSPLNKCSLAGVSETGPGAAELTVKGVVADHL